MARKGNPVFFTPAGTAQYPWLNKPDTKFDADGVYKTNLILSAEDFNAPNKKLGGKSLQQVLTDAVEAKMAETLAELPKAAASKVKTADVYEDELDDQGEPTGNVKLHFKLKAKVTVKSSGKTFEQKPTLVDSKNKVIDDIIYGGSTIKLSFSPIPYYMASTKTVGVSLRMIAVQVLDLVSRGGGDTGFDVEDGYVGESPAPAAPRFESSTDEDESGDVDDDEF